MIVEVCVAGLAYLGYREYKNGKLAKAVDTIASDVKSLLPKAEAEVKSVASAVVAEAKKL